MTSVDLSTSSRESSSESLVLPAITVQPLCSSQYKVSVRDKLRQASCPAILPALTITQDTDQPSYVQDRYFTHKDNIRSEDGVYFTQSSLQLPYLPSRSPRASVSSQGRRRSSVVTSSLFDVTPVCMYFTTQL